MTNNCEIDDYEYSSPQIGHELIDALIQAAWDHGQHIAAADDGACNYPTVAQGNNVRQLALKLYNLIKV